MQSFFCAVQYHSFLRGQAPSMMKPSRLAARKIGGSPIKSDMKFKNWVRKCISVLSPSCNGSHNWSQNRGMCGYHQKKKVENGDNYSTAEEQHEKEWPWQIGAGHASVECAED